MVDVEALVPGAMLLASKLQPPPVRLEVVERPQLMAALAVEPAPALTLVVDQAGGGKTTLLAAWRRAAGAGGTAWLSLDRADNDPVRFWTYALAALRTARPGIGAAALASLRAPYADPATVALPSLLNELGRERDPLVLVLDDYSLISNGSIHRAMDFLLRRLPGGLRMVLAARSDPPIAALARLRVAGDLLEIRADRLRFTEAESGALLNEAMGLGLGPTAVGRLHRRTEGWPAGLHLAALSVRDRADAEDFIEEFAGNDRHVVDFLGAEVLDGQPPDVRDFLLRTSVLERLSAPLCDAVTGRSDSARLLDAVERSNLFLVPLDGHREWWRYHGLFAELLRHELARVVDEEPTDLHRRAAAWFLARGEAADAIQHLLAAGDAERAANLVAADWLRFLAQGRIATVAGWLASLPRELIAAEARLALVAAWVARADGRLHDVQPLLDAAARAPGRSRPLDGTASVESSAAMVGSLHRLSVGDVGGAVEHGRRAVALESPGSLWRPTACMVLGVAEHAAGRPDVARGALEEAARDGRPVGQHLSVVLALGHLAAIAVDEGDVARGRALAEEALALALAQRLEEYQHVSMAHLARGRALLAEGRSDQGEAEVRRALELAQRGGAPLQAAACLLTLAGSAAGDPERASVADDLRREAEDLIAGCPDAGVLARAGRRPAQAGLAPGPGDPGPALTDRELAVLRLLGEDLSNRGIGAALYLSQNTVKTHLRHLYRKLGAASREEALARARESGLA